MEKQKILYAEDEDCIFTILARSSKQIYGDNYDFVHAPDIESALSKFNEGKFDACISDGLNGGWKKFYDSVREKETSKNLPFILYSSDGDALNKVMSLMHSDKNLGIIQKPAELDELFEHLKNFLSNKL
jgi:DNA-binding NtrC family response regulator